MKPTIQKWVDALRSGKYKQAKGTLHDAKTGGFCCLGVYCKVITKDSKAYLGSGSEGPEEAYDKFNSLLGHKLKNELIQMNDTGKTFDEIADVLERKYKERNENLLHG